MSSYLVHADGVLPVPWLAAPLARAARLRGHALLMHGGVGRGLFELAMCWAQAQLCATPSDDGVPCGRCAECHLVLAQSHPDLLVLLPEALRESVGWRVDEDNGRERSTKPSQDIRVDELRVAVDWGARSTSRARCKVMVLHPATSMNAVTANALLKTLEEPPGDLRLVLTAHTPGDLLPTVASRCQHLRLDAPKTQEALAWLAAEGVEDADVILRASGGEPLLARELSLQGLDARAWQTLPRAIAAGHSAPLAGWSLPRVVDALFKVCHDTMCLTAQAPTRYFDASSLPGPAPWEELRTWSLNLGEASRQSEHPLQLALAVDAMVARASRVWDSSKDRQGIRALPRRGH